MSVKLHKVELSNIRSHKHIVFEPKDSGITAISGPNGAGKSTIVDSIAWALFGTKPKGVSKTSAIYRNGAIFGKDKCYARVTIEIDGQTYEIERRMISKAGAVECDLWLIGDNGEKDHLAGPSVSHTESKIRQTLKMDEKGFLAAILVQQKQVDNLISAQPKDRAKIIEKLTGISAITSALASAREENNALKKITAQNSVSQEGLDDLNKEKTKLENTLNKEIEKLKKQKTKTEKTRDTYKDTKTSYDEKLQASNKSNKLKNTATILETKIESTEEQIEKLITEKDERKKKLTSLETGISFSEVKEKLDNLNDRLISDESRHKNNADFIAKAKKENEEYDVIISSSKTQGKDNVIAFIDKAKAAIKKIEDMEGNLNDKIVSLKANIVKLDNAVSILTDGDGTCPTCLQRVEDASVAVNALHHEKSGLESEIASLQEKLEGYAIKRENNEDNLLRAEKSLYSIETKEKNESEIKEAEHENIELDGKIKVLRTEIKSLDNIYQNVKYKDSIKNEYDSLLQSIKTMNFDLNEMMGQLSSAKAELKELGAVSPDVLEKLRLRVESLQDDYQKQLQDFNDLKGDVGINKERLSHLTSDITKYSNELDKYKDLLKQVEVASTTTKVIEEFRENKIKSSVPVIEAYASDLINRFTEGKFVALRLDAKFNTTVVLADGTERNVGLLSGGELSVAAMALRIAISMLLNGGDSQNLIILDEVLVSQDTNRSDLILSTIKDVCKGQVVFIAHSTIVNEASDKIVELNASE